MDKVLIFWDDLQVIFWTQREHKTKTWTDGFCSYIFDFVLYLTVTKTIFRPSCVEINLLINICNEEESFRFVSILEMEISKNFKLVETLKCLLSLKQTLRVLI